MHLPRPAIACFALFLGAFSAVAALGCSSPSVSDTEDELASIPSEVIGSYSSPRGAIELRKDGTYRGGYKPSYYDLDAGSDSANHGATYDAATYVDAGAIPGKNAPKGGSPYPEGTGPNASTGLGLGLQGNDPGIIQDEAGTFRVTESRRIDGVLQGKMLFRPDNAAARFADFEVLPGTGLHVVTGMDNQIWHVADDQIWHREM